MTPPIYRPRGPYLATFFAALLAAGSAVFWVLGTLGASTQASDVVLAATTRAGPDAQGLARALGGGASQVQAPQAAPPSTQYQLLGTVVGPLGQGYALLGVDGAPPKSYGVGAVLAQGQVLLSVSARGAKIGSSLQADAALELTLPKLSGP